MRHTPFLILLWCFALACTETSKPGVPSASNAPEPDRLAFVFSKKAMTPADEVNDDWCHVPFASAAVISADPANFNRRLFTLSDDPHRVVVDYGKMVAALILKRTGNRVEIFTSNHYPRCLTNHKFITIAADGNSFRFDDGRYIKFDVQLIPLANGIQIALEMAPGAGYGIIVSR